MYKSSPNICLKDARGLSGDLGENGTQRATIALTLSGLNRLKCQAATAPQSLPTTKAFPWFHAFSVKFTK